MDLPPEIIREILIFCGYPPKYMRVCKTFKDIAYPYEDNQLITPTDLNRYAYDEDWDLFLLRMLQHPNEALEIAHLYQRMNIAYKLYISLLEDKSLPIDYTGAYFYQVFKLEHQYLGYEFGDYHKTIVGNYDEGFNSLYLGYMTKDMREHILSYHDSYTISDITEEIYLMLRDKPTGTAPDHIVLQHYGWDTTIPYLQCIAELVMKGILQGKDVHNQIYCMMKTPYVTPTMVACILKYGEIKITLDIYTNVHICINDVNQMVLTECYGELAE